MSKFLMLSLSTFVASKSKSKPYNFSTSLIKKCLFCDRPCNLLIRELISTVS